MIGKDAIVAALRQCESSLTRAALYLLDHNLAEGQRALDAAAATFAIIKLAELRGARAEDSSGCIFCDLALPRMGDDLGYYHEAKARIIRCRKDKR